MSENKFVSLFPLFTVMRMFLCFSSSFSHYFLQVSKAGPLHCSKAESFSCFFRTDDQKSFVTFAMSSVIFTQFVNHFNSISFYEEWVHKGRSIYWHVNKEQKTDFRLRLIAESFYIKIMAKVWEIGGLLKLLFQYLYQIITEFPRAGISSAYAIDEWTDIFFGAENNWWALKIYLVLFCITRATWIFLRYYRN